MKSKVYSKYPTFCSLATIIMHYSYSLSVLFIMLSLTALAQEDCSLRKEEDNIRIFTCNAEESGFRWIKADFTASGKPEDFARVMFNVDKYLDWQHNSVSVQLIKRISDSELIYHIEFSAPWPASHRDVTVHLKIQKATATQPMIISTQSVTGYVPEKKNIIRVPMSHATWRVYNLTSGQLKIDYLSRIEPGGNVTPWLMNMVLAEAPYQSFQKLRVQIAQ